MTIPQERAILLVDDEENILAALTRLLRRDGYRILKANSGREALELLTTTKVGVILSDQRMPEMSGVEFLRKAKALYPETLRIVLSGYTELKSVTDAINEGAVYKFLTKPWEDELLRAHVREAFEHYEMARENRRLTREILHANQELTAAKQDLELLVGKKTLEAAHSGNVLKVSQEILEYLPVGVIGVDDSGMIAIANRKAAQIFGAGTGLVGRLVNETLPENMAHCVVLSANQGMGGHRPCQLPDGSPAELWCHPMGSQSESRGVVLLIVPIDGESRHGH
ncbi:MAG: response regulator [Sulfuricella sp.]|nr:response regulator [Sulfuricella sp.]